ncbi:MAG: twin-arginine translocase subunit TatC [Dissulfurimicrobium sp.]|uniref:twin-arginine translocase subunit TatC n=1 Tax=Dissulfurimicrobium TaxID=1769732 RepID=UPI001EDA9F05|nr:twin-arginine translocase subunit TatC [Dissulfurimicrobium hydrothermale]UKL14190.1 twin-arginine translocase subunit TatC [Dissulfurimicrobium hydrothermale]
MSIDRIPFGAHLAELRRRLIYCVLTLAAAFFICYWASDYLVSALFYPIRQALPPGSTMVFTSLTEGFMTYLKVSFWAAVIVSTPMFAYQAWAFLAPGLYENEKRRITVFAGWAATLFTTGAAFGYWVIMPVVLSITMGFASKGLEAMPRLQDYLVFVLKTMLCFGITFEMPFLMAFTVRLGLVPGGYFKKHRKIFYLTLYILAVALAPTDIFSQIMLLAPLIGVFEIGILAAAKKNGPQ